MSDAFDPARDLDDDRLAKVLEDIANARRGVFGPADLDAKCRKVQGYPPRVRSLEDDFLYLFGGWVRKGQELEYDLHALEQVAVNTLMRTLMLIMRASKEQQGDVLLPGRPAIMAHWHAQAALAGPGLQNGDIYELFDMQTELDAALREAALELDDEPDDGETVH